jgi:PAS domain S-box-containing protein
MTLAMSLVFVHYYRDQNHPKLIEDPGFLLGLVVMTVPVLIWAWICSYGPLGPRNKKLYGVSSPEQEDTPTNLGSSIAENTNNESSVRSHLSVAGPSGSQSDPNLNEAQAALRTRLAGMEARLVELTSLIENQNAEIQKSAKLLSEREEENVKLSHQKNAFEAQIAQFTEERGQETARRQQLQSALEASEYRYRSLLDGVSDSVFFTSSAGVIEYVSPATKDLFGVPLEEFLGGGMNFAAPEDEKRVEEFLRQLRQKSSITYRIMNPSGDSARDKYVSHRINIMEMPGKRKIVIHSLSEVTATVLSEKQKIEYERQLIHASKLASLGTMGAGVAHELNNPITVIKGYMERIRKDLLATMGETHALVGIVDKVIKHVGRMQTITEQLRIFSRREVYQDEWTSVSIDRLIQDALELQRHLLSGSQIELRMEMSDPSPIIAVNTTNFESVIQNLVGNAYDAHLSRREGSENDISGTSGKNDGGSIRPMDQDSSKPFIEVKVYERASDTVVLEVSDNAGGIPQSILTKIFDPFFTTKPPGKGTGLGLALVQSIVTNHKGHLFCETKEGYGTTFRIELPISSSMAISAHLSGPSSRRA